MGATLAQAQTVPVSLHSSILDAAPGSITWNGITVFGTADVGFAYQNHGAPLNGLYISGLDFFAASTKNLVKTVSTVAPNGLEQSKIGAKGDVPLAPDWSVVFRIEAGFNPISGQLANGPGSIAENSGVPQLQQTGFGDSSRAGQFINGVIFAGLSNPVLGTLTFGRQQSLLLDSIAKYDPQELSYAFSLIGFAGATAGGGVTENARLDDTLKYVYKLGPVHASGMYVSGGNGTGLFGDGYGFNVGGDYKGFSLDYTYEKMVGGVLVAPLAFGTGAGQCEAGSAVKPCTSNGVGGTISDNETWSIQGKYSFDLSWAKTTLYTGYEHISYADPHHQVGVGTYAQGGYQLLAVTNNKYFTDKEFQVTWAGTKFALANGVTLTGAYYRYDQNSYLTGAAVSCATATANNVKNKSFIGNTTGDNCSGTLNGASFVVDYQMTMRLDLYAGVTYSIAGGGLESGYVNNSLTSFMTGARLRF